MCVIIAMVVAAAAVCVFVCVHWWLCVVVRGCVCVCVCVCVCSGGGGLHTVSLSSAWDAWHGSEESSNVPVYSAP